MIMQSYRDLIVWQKAIDYVEICYRISENFPAKEVYGLTSQLRRAAVSIPSNIAEGYGRETRGEYIHFLGIAKGSLKESETQIMIAERLNFISNQDAQKALIQAETVGKLLYALIKSLKQK
ncbi:MAG: four helix bundle protein [Blastocatellia bacterium]|nr:four helix bundle protein [Blastocatellia bacterium]